MGQAAAASDHPFGQVCDLHDLTGTEARSPFKGTVRPMEAEDAESILSIYGEGIATGHSTFQATTGSWTEFEAGKRASPRLVACDLHGDVIGFALLSSTSSRPVYADICEIMIYIADKARGQGAGHALMETMIHQSEAAGIWMLVAGIFPENKASLILHAAHGFHCTGRQTAAGKMTHGPMAGQWRDVLSLQRRL